MTLIEYIKLMIIQMCNQENLSVSRLAKLSGLPTSTVENIIVGLSKNPGVLTIEKLCIGFEISMSDFFKEYKG